MVVVFRVVYVCAAFLSIAAGALVMASFFIAKHAPQNDRVLVISLVVSVVFLGAGLVLFGIQRHVAAIVAARRDRDGDSLRNLSMHIDPLVANLLAGAPLSARCSEA
jgi:uncharacterized membrane protein HdeD (DUF308 family)